MGCGASRTDVIKSVVSESNRKGHKLKSKNSEAGVEGSNGNNNSHTPNMDSLNSEASTIPASEKYQNFNGHNEHLKPLTLPPLKPPRTFKVESMDNLDGNEVNSNRPKAEPVAFEVPAADVPGESLIKKHPPRRLRRIIEPDQSTPEQQPALTHDLLQEKVQLANERRNNVLTQRVASARQKSARTTRVRRAIPESQILSEFANGGIESGTQEENELNLNQPQFM